MNKNQEKIEKALKRIDNALESINSDEDWIKYLYFQSKFYHYSFRNTILIMLQNPNATFVKGYKAWNKLGRYVIKGSKGLAILAPCIHYMDVFKEPVNKSEYHDADVEVVKKKILSGFRITYVYDLADTAGSDEFLPVLVTGLVGNGEPEKQIYEGLLRIISKEYQIKEVEKSASKGAFNLQTQVISIRSDLEYLQKVKTILHEYAHAIDFEMNSEDDISRNQRELIAESVAFVVSLSLGLDTIRYSSSYIMSWLKDRQKLKLIADTVQKISYKILTNLAESKDPAFLYLRRMMNNEEETN